MNQQKKKQKTNYNHNRQRQIDSTILHSKKLKLFKEKIQRIFAKLYIIALIPQHIWCIKL